MGGRQVRSLELPRMFLGSRLAVTCIHVQWVDSGDTASPGRLNEVAGLLHAPLRQSLDQPLHDTREAGVPVRRHLVAPGVRLQQARPPRPTPRPRAAAGFLAEGRVLERAVGDV
jgi:hypothetical protein